MVRMTGVGPARINRQNLNLMRLPISPHPHTIKLNYILPNISISRFQNPFNALYIVCCPQRGLFGLKHLPPSIIESNLITFPVQTILDNDKPL